MNLGKFLAYNNAVPIAIGVLVLGGTSAFAAEDPSAIYSASQKVVSVDNTYIANKDLSTYSPSIQITGVTEDDTNYYVGYTFATIDVDNYVWKDVQRTDAMTVSKGALAGRDLGVYVTGLFNNIIANEQVRLQQTQDSAKQSISQKTIATTYGGLVGKMLNDTTETLPGYTPVVTPPTPQVQTASADAAAPSTPDTSAPAPSASPASSGNSLSQGTLTMQIMGNNPAHIPIKTQYADLGVYVTDPADGNPSTHTFFNGQEVVSVQIDTTLPGTYTITYKASDKNGNNVAGTREVDVFDPNPPVSLPSASSTPSTTTDTATSTN